MEARDRSAGAAALLWGLAIAVAAAATWSVQRGWYRNTWTDQYIATQLKNALPARDRLPPNTRFLLEDARWNWYLGNQHMVLYSKSTRALFTAKNAAEVESALRNAGVGGVILLKGSLDQWWKGSTLLEFLEGGRAMRVAPDDENFAIYVLRS